MVSGLAVVAVRSAERRLAVAGAEFEHRGGVRLVLQQHAEVDQGVCRGQYERGRALLPHLGFVVVAGAPDQLDVLHAADQTQLQQQPNEDRDRALARHLGLEEHLPFEDVRVLSRRFRDAEDLSRLHAEESDG